MSGPTKPLRTVEGKLMKDADGRLYYKGEEVVVVRVEDCQKAIQEAVEAGYRQSVLEKNK